MTTTRAMLLCFLASVHTMAADAEGPPENSPTFNKDVLPILADHCFKCHGADAAARKAGLRLDVESAAKHPQPSGLAAVQPGVKDQSALYQRITATGDDRMPPPAAGDVLSPREIEILANWIDAGAVWEDHWAYIAPVLPTLPDVSTPAWPRSGIDRFVLARLDRNAIAPSPEADRRTLIRRLYLDLTGLPPAPDRVARFVDDTAPNA